MSPKFSNFLSERKIHPSPHMSTSNPDPNVKGTAKSRSTYAFELDLAGVGKQPKTHNHAAKCAQMQMDSNSGVRRVVSQTRRSSSTIEVRPSTNIASRPQRVTRKSSAEADSATRRVIFSTLYESQSQASPLCRNQIRKHTIIPNTTTSMSAGMSANGNATRDGKHLATFKNDTITHDLHPHPHQSQIHSEGSEIPIKANAPASGKDTTTSTCTSVLSQYASDALEGTTDDSSITSSKGSLLPVQQQPSTENMTIDPTQTLDDPIHEPKQYSPTSTANDIHKKILPGPSILKNKSSQPQKTPRTIDTNMGMMLMTPNTASKLAKTSSLSARKLILPRPELSSASINTNANANIITTHQAPILPLPDTGINTGSDIGRDIKQPYLTSQSSAQQLEKVHLQAVRPIATLATPPNEKWSLPSLHKSISDSCIDNIQCLSISSDESDRDDSSIPSRTTFDDSADNPDIQQSSSCNNENNHQHNSSVFITRHISHEEIITQRRKIRFDPRVWVHEIQKPDIGEIWYTPAELERFKAEAVVRIREWAKKNRERRYSYSANMIGTGTGRIINTSLIKMHPEYRAPSKAIFTNPALTLDAEDEEETNDTVMRKTRYDLARKEIKKILLVDSHDIFLKLLSKGIKMMMPTAEITTAYNTTEALEKMEAGRREDPQFSHGFDMFVIEERLQRPSQCDVRKVGMGMGMGRANSLNLVVPSSGSSLIQRIASDVEKVIIPTKRYPVVVGISAYIGKDEQKLRQSGCDFVWGKPPPKMNEGLRDKILMTILHKRGKATAAKGCLYDDRDNSKNTNA